MTGNNTEEPNIALDEAGLSNDGKAKREELDRLEEAEKRILAVNFSKGFIKGFIKGYVKEQLKQIEERAPKLARQHLNLDSVAEFSGLTKEAVAQILKDEGIV